MERTSSCGGRGTRTGRLFYVQIVRIANMAILTTLLDDYARKKSYILMYKLFAFLNLSTKFVSICLAMLAASTDVHISVENLSNGATTQPPCTPRNCECFLYLFFI